MMVGENQDERHPLGIEDPHCPIRRMLAEELVRQRAPDWTSATKQDRQWAQEDALKMQKAHEEVARSMFSFKGPAPGETK